MIVRTVMGYIELGTGEEDSPCNREISTEDYAYLHQEPNEGTNNSAKHRDGLGHRDFGCSAGKCCLVKRLWRDPANTNPAAYFAAIHPDPGSTCPTSPRHRDPSETLNLELEALNPNS